MSGARLTAGPELDRIVAERVMGLTDASDDDYRAWQPSTNIAHAWEVVERLRPTGARLILTDYGPDWDAVFRRSDDTYECAQADTAPLAICLAALRAVGGGT